MSNIDDLFLMTLMFALGGAFRLYEEHLLQRHLRVALSLTRLNREENEQLVQTTVQRGFLYRCFIMVLIVTSPERALDRIRRDLGSYRAPNRTGDSSVRKSP
jgi:hypothetical protein